MITATVTELPESRVRVDAEVPSDEVERRLQQAARELGRQLKVPGFRKGKVPPQVVIRRVGRVAVFEEMIRNSLSGWYSDALDASGIDPVGDPDVNVAEMPVDGGPLSFTIEIGVLPVATLGNYKGLEVGRRDVEVKPAAIDEELERLRDRIATLETVERPAASGDHLVVDFVGTIDGEPFEGGEGRDQLLELSSGQLLEGFEQQLIGAAAGDQRDVEVTFPSDHEAYPDKDASFAVTVKEVKEKRLPELSDEFAEETAGFDTLQELRDDIERRLAETQQREIDREFEQAVLDAVVAASTVEVPAKLIHERAHQIWHQMVHALERQGISKEAYLQIAGKADEHDMVNEAEPDADRAIRRESVLAAVIEAESIDPTEEELLEALRPSADNEGMSPDDLLERLTKTDRIDRVREDLINRRAIELLVAAAKPVPLKAKGESAADSGAEPDPDDE